MGFVERVFREIDHLIIDLVRNLFINPVRHTARHAFGFIAVYKVLPFFLHDLGLFL